MTGYGRYRGRRIFDVKKRILTQCHAEKRGYVTDCLIFEGEKDRDGYGRIKDHGKYRQAHSVLVDPTDDPKKNELDHLCYQVDCIRPSHLEWVTHEENLKRRRDRRKTTEENP